ncbi:MAG: arsenate reductase ArsC [Candidatus Omnitrophota bacterium]
MEKKKVLFICTHNSARSQIAEGLLKSLYGNHYEVYSAGTEPSTVNLFAIKVMAEIGIDISQQRSKSINEFFDSQFDYVITVCDLAKNACPFFPNGKNYVHKSFKDPSEISGSHTKKLEAFRNARDEIKQWIENSFFKEIGK